MVVGPKYQKPAFDPPENWKSPSSTVAEALPEGPWWCLFEDSQLDELEQLAAAQNPNLQSLVAHIDAAQAQLTQARSFLFPSIIFAGEASQFKTSGNQPFGIPIQSIESREYTGILNFNYELDLWGQVRRGYERATSAIEESIALYQHALLGLQAQVASLYFEIRILDENHKLLELALELRTKSRELIERRMQAGISNGLELAQAQTLEASTQTRIAEVKRQRAIAEHALAVLCGLTPSTFELDQHRLTARPVHVPAGLPSTLLQRRPDISAAESQLKQALATAGITYASLFPNISLTGQFGYLSQSSRNLLSSSSNLWSFGPTISLPIFQGGQIIGQYQEAMARYHSLAAQYQEKVLEAFQDVENALTNIHYQQEAQRAQNATVIAAQKAEFLSELRYKKGLVSYLEVIDAQRTALASKEEALFILNNQFLASIALIKALGGGWNESDLACFSRLEDPI